MKDLYTTGEAAEICRLSQQSIIRCFDSGHLKGFRVPGSKFRKIPRQNLVKFMRDNNIPLDTIDFGALTPSLHRAITIALKELEDNNYARYAIEPGAEDESEGAKLLREVLTSVKD